MITYIIFDLDGCIADDRVRLPLIDHDLDDPWAEYHDGCTNDPLINEQWAAISKYHLCTPVFFTSRPEAVRKKTEWWLTNVAELDPTLLFMRPDDDRVLTVELKERFLRKFECAHGSTPFAIAAALDDRKDVLDMYEGYDIQAIQTFYPERVPA